MGASSKRVRSCFVCMFTKNFDPAFFGTNPLFFYVVLCYNKGIERFGCLSCPQGQCAFCFQKNKGVLTLKKALSVWLSLAIILSCMLVPGLSVSAASDHTGSTFLINGNTFQGLSVSERTMADNGDGTYCFPYHIQQDELVRVYFTELNADGTTRDYTNDYYYKTFDFTTNTTQEITIVFDPDAYPYLSVEGEDIRPRYGNKYFYVYCSFEGQTQFSREDGLMTVDENGVYSVTYKNVPPCDAIFDVYVESAGEAILGFYGYNTFPAKITAPCDVTVYFEPAY